MGTRPMSEATELWMVWAARIEVMNGLEIGVDGTQKGSEDKMGDAWMRGEEYDAMEGTICQGELLSMGYWHEMMLRPVANEY